MVQKIQVYFSVPMLFMRKLVKEVHRSFDWSKLDSLAHWVLEEGIRIQQIPAPTFDEQRRAEYVLNRFREFGLQDVWIDERFNAYGRLVGHNPSADAVMIMAHTDTVFPIDTDLTIRREQDIVYGPGLGDNSVGVSGMLGLAKAIKDAGITPHADLWFVATSCEEGLGDLNGVRAAFAHLKDKLGAVINLEGLAFGHIYHAGIAVHRLKITARAEGGHSWLHYGRPSAIHGLMELGARITRLNPPISPRTTYNIGIIEGGKAINAIATEASFWLDMRSEDRKELLILRDAVLNEIKQVSRAGLTFETEIVGDRPSGAISMRHPLVQGALTALEVLNIRGALETGSTDGNIPLEAGCPTVTIGITRGGNAHRLDEYVDRTPIKLGMRQLITLALATSEFMLSEDSERAIGD